jgi:hypothetical protein
MGMSDTAGWSLWPALRSTRPLAAFRLACGALLALHFLRMLGAVPALLAGGGLWDIERAREVVPGRDLAVLISALGAGELRVLLGSAAALCVCLGLGHRTRACAALLLPVSVGLSGALLPLANLDDALANLLLVWFVLLPDAGRFTLRRGRIVWPRRALVPGWSVGLLVAQLMLLQLGLSLLRNEPTASAEDAVRHAALLGAPACFIATAAWPRLIGLALGVIAHGMLLAGSSLLLVPGALLSALVLLWGERSAGAPARVAISADTVIAAALLALLAAAPVSSSAGRVLADAGVVLPGAGQPPRQRWQRIWAEHDDGSRAPGSLDLPLADARVQTLLFHLVEPSALAPALKDDLARRLAARFCRRSGRERPSAVLMLGASTRKQELAWFTCEGRGALPETLRLRAHRQGRDVGSNDTSSLERDRITEHAGETT